MILVAGPERWDTFGVPVLTSVAGAALAIGLREVLCNPVLLPHFLMQTGVAYFVRGARAARVSSLHFECDAHSLLFGLRQINSLPEQLQPTHNDAMLVMDALAEFAFTCPEVAAQYAAELRRLYERIRPLIFMDIAHAAISQN